MPPDIKLLQGNRLVSSIIDPEDLHHQLYTLWIRNDIWQQNGKSEEKNWDFK